MSGTQLINTQSLANGNDGQGEALQDGGFKINLHALTTPIGADTLNAGYFAWNPDTGVSLGYTAVQIIQAAIDYAVANSFGAVWIPKKVGSTTLLPYDASAVTFNNAVHMIREGGPVHMVDLRAYGANETNAENNDEIQAALDAAVYGKIGTVWVPPAATGSPPHFRVSKPLWVKGPISILGDGVGYNNVTTCSRIASNDQFRGGPILALQSAGTTIQGLTTALVGTGQAYAFNGSNYWITLRNGNNQLDLNGLSALTVECYVKGTGSPNNAIITSRGRYALGDAQNNAFSLEGSTGDCFFRVTTSGSGLVSVNGNPTGISDGILHHLAGTYDGTTVRLFVDGVLKASAGATGTIVQHVAEDVCVGAGIALAPDETLDNNCNPPMTIDVPWISDVAKWTANFTPSYTKGVSDSTTRALINFDQHIGQFTRQQTRFGDAWAWERQLVTGRIGNGFRMDGVTLDCGGRTTGLHVRCLDWSVSRFYAPDARISIDAVQGYDYTVDRFFVIGPGGTGGRYGMVFGQNAGIGTVQNGWTQGMFEVGLDSNLYQTSFNSGA